MLLPDLKTATDALNHVVDWFAKALQVNEVTEICDAAATYAKAHVGSQPDESVSKALVISFNDEALKLTKQKFKDAGIDIATQRRKTAEKDADDIVKAIHDMEKNQMTEKVRFVVATEQIKSVPKYSPEELCNSTDLLRRVALLESKMSKLDDSHAALEVQVTKNTVLVQSDKFAKAQTDVPREKLRNPPDATRVSTHAPRGAHRGGYGGGKTQIDRSAAAALKGQQWPKVGEFSGTTSTPIVHPSLKTSNKYSVLSTPGTPSGGKRRRTDSETSEDDMYVDTSGANETTIVPGSSAVYYASQKVRAEAEAGFQFPKGRRNRFHTAGKIEGATDLTGGPDKIDVVIARVGLKHTKENIADYLTKLDVPCGADDVQELEMRDDAKTKAFKVSIKAEFETKVLSGELFNTRIKVWKFRPKRASSDELGPKTQ